MADKAERPAWRGLVVPAVFTLIGLVILISLGNWQVRRLAWKEDLIATIHTRVVSEPVSLETALAAWKKTGDIAYQPVRVAGTFDHSHEFHVNSTDKGEVGWNVYTPLVTDDGHTVLVNRGFVPYDKKEPETRAEGEVEGPVAFVGLARTPLAEKPNYFVPDNDVSGNVFYWRDFATMAKQAGIAGDSGLVPFFVEVREMDVPGSWPRGGVTRVTLPNNHLQYAVTWYGLALTLVGVFAAFAWTRLRRRPEGAEPSVSK
ncbi:SURF1 family protein [Rhodobium gokarnense]|uniref:SURF1-like protein n=1 Tax=Rhodobium gokarnense TaxID=364296 RepID=A0ABT3HCS0_9HYPH|nr:SURF1 family protein [Rhodobium gokarnense]MCW2308199.1 surfeit locus 1 family protein [Rhodobium gokarnense]